MVNIDHSHQLYVSSIQVLNLEFRLIVQETPTQSYIGDWSNTTFKSNQFLSLRQKLEYTYA